MATMKDKCRGELSAAIGRELTNAEAEKISGALSDAMKKLYNQNPTAVKAMKPNELYAKAVEQAKNDLIEKAVQSKIRSAENALKVIRNNAEVNSVPIKDQVNQIWKMLVDKAELSHSGMSSVESRIHAINSDAWAKLPSLQNIILDDAKMNGFIDAVFGGKVDNPLIMKSAKEFQDMNAGLIKDAQNAGMPITPLDNWHVPQGLSSYKAAVNVNGFIDDLLQHINPEIYRHDNGTKYTPDELKEFFTHAAETIATDGASKDKTPGAGRALGSGRGYQKERQIHYKDAASWKYMQNKYGDMTTGQMISRHISALSRDIALTEQFGSDYRGGFNELIRATKARIYPNQTEAARTELEKQFSLAQRYFENLVGDIGHTTAEGAAWARKFDIAKNFIGFWSLGGSGINSMPDLASMANLAKLSNMPEITLWTKTLRNFLLPHNPRDVEMVNRLGLGAQTILADLNAYVRDDWMLTKSKQAVNFTTKYGLLQRFERSKMMAVSNVMHDAIGAITRNHEYAGLLPGDRKIFDANGVDQTVFNIWKAADVERGQDGKNTILMPQHVYNIPDDIMLPLVQDKVDAMELFHKDAIDKLEERSFQEARWINRRKDKLTDYHKKLAAMIAKYVGTRENNATKLDEHTQNRIELLNAHAERAKAEADIAAYLATEKHQDKIKDMLWAVANGGDIERRSISETQTGDTSLSASASHLRKNKKGSSVIKDGENIPVNNLEDINPLMDVGKFSESKSLSEKTNSTTQAFSRQRGAIGEKLGARLAKSERNIKDAQKRFDDSAKKSQSEIDAKQVELNNRLQKKFTELEKFHHEYTNSIAKRQEIIDEWQKVAGNSRDKIIAEARRDAALKLSSTVGREVRFASGSPGIQRKVDLNMDAERNGLASEIGRSWTFLKATPISVIHNNWERSGSMRDTHLGVIALRAKYLATSAALGAMVYNLQNLFNGRDLFNPFDSSQDKYAYKVVKSLMVGGSLGIYGDIFLQDYSGAHSTSSVSGVLGGPMLGTMDEIGQLVGDVKRMGQGGDADLGGDTVRFLKRRTLPNIFYTKALQDHLIFQQAQEYFSPGYSQRAYRRQVKGSGVESWYTPGDLLPDRLPKFAK